MRLLRQNLGIDEMVRYKYFLFLDPSGNVGKVCDVLERNFVGYDLNNYIS